MVIRTAAKSDVGRVRKINEDAFALDEKLGLSIVADGMGGHQGGQVASRLAVQTICTVAAQRQQEVVAGLAHGLTPASPVLLVLSDGLRAACAAVYEAARKDVALQGMGTTVTALIVGQAQAFVAHVGDSRCYLQRGDSIVQVTDDHSLVNEQIKAGLLTTEQGRHSRLKNVITRCVGFERDVVVDTFALALEAGDNLLLCSDGLSNLVDDTEIGLQLRQGSPEQVVAYLVSLACARGGDDNVTVICVRIESL